MDKLRHVTHLVQLRDAMIPIMFITQDYGLKTQEKLVSKIFTSILDEIKSYGIKEPAELSVTRGILYDLQNRPVRL